MIGRHKPRSGYDLQPDVADGYVGLQVPNEDAALRFAARVTICVPSVAAARQQWAERQNRFAVAPPLPQGEIIRTTGSVCGESRFTGR
jgi:hypothetical protein